jgi:hypothetical protein
VGLIALAFYWLTAAPGLTWLHQGADGGELLAAAIVDGVPHPPGYPLYMLLLQGWLTFTGALLPSSDLAWRGNLASGLAAALTAALTVWVAGRLLPDARWRWLWAALAGLAWTVTPLAWSQAVITEVYALHTMWFAWLALTGARRWLRIGAALAAGLALAGVLTVRTWLAAGNGPPPINWGYADQWSGLWWLLSGAAYRGYLFSVPLEALLGRLAAWAATLTAQYTPVGLALALVGLARWDHQAAWLRNFSLLWLAPVSIYALGYNTRDSDIYLLPVVWLMALWLAQGLAVIDAWLGARLPRPKIGTGVLAMLALAGVLLAGGWRWTMTAGSGDHAAQDYLAGAATVLEPDAIVVSYDDQETFALWYGVWGDAVLASKAPGVTPINEPLYQFAWYRRLLGVLHPQIPGITDSVSAVVAANGAVRPIYFTRHPTPYPGFSAEQVGPLWRLRPSAP